MHSHHLGETIQVLVSSPEPTVAAFLRSQLLPSDFEVTSVRPGAAFPEMIRNIRPQIAILDRVHERPESAQMEIAMIKEECPDARIIVLSEQSSTTDAEVVEAGVFYYLAGGASPPAELIRVIDAAVASLRSRPRSPTG
jgi:CheY-like chemotaxis protein